MLSHRSRRFSFLSLLFLSLWCLSFTVLYLRSGLQQHTHLGSSPYEIFPGKNSTISANVLRENDDLRRFRTQIRNWPPGKPKALVYMLFEYQRTASLTRALAHLQFTFLMWGCNYPVVLFHEDDVQYWVKPFLRTLFFGMDIYFQEVKFAIPPGVTFNRSEFVHGKFCSRAHEVGYKHMCQFQTNGAFKQPTLQLVDWYWRMDTDAVLTSWTRNYDPFKFMERNQLVYGYRQTSVDGPGCMYNLTDFTEDYVQRMRQNFTNAATANLVKPIADRSKSKRFSLNSVFPWFEVPEDRTYKRIFFTNFELSSMNFWRRKEVWDYLEAVEQSAGVYKYRWGDAPVHTLAIGLFAPRDSLHQFTDKELTYKHFQCAHCEEWYRLTDVLKVLVLSSCFVAPFIAYWVCSALLRKLYSCYRTWKSSHKSKTSV